MRDKTRFILLSILGFIIVVAIALFIKINLLQSANNSITEEVSQQYIYIMRAVDGKIGVFQGEELAYIMDVYVQNLPEADIQMLEQGIYIESEEELNRLIEAFDS